MSTEAPTQERPATVRELEREITRIERQQVELRKSFGTAMTGADGRSVKAELERLRRRRNTIIISELPLARQRGDDDDLAPVVAEVPVEQLQAEAREASDVLASLRRELAGIPGALRSATRDDPMKVPALRHRRDELAELVVAAEIASLTIEQRLASAQISVTQPALRAAVELVEVRRDELKVAQAALDAAVAALHAERASITETAQFSSNARARLAELRAQSSEDAGPVVRSRPHAIR